MTKLLKILAGLLLLVLVAALLILLLVDPNDFKDEIQARIEAVTGRQVTIAGDLELTFFPWLGVAVGKVSVANPPGFGTEPFAELARADVRAKLLPLLSGRLEVARVRVHGLHLSLVRGADGRGNWEDQAHEPIPLPAGDHAVQLAETPTPGVPPLAEWAAGQPSTPQQPTPERLTPKPPIGEHPADQQPAGGQPGSWAFAVGGIELVDAQITWEDRGRAQRVLVEELGLTLGPVALGETAELHLEGRLVADGPTELQTRFAGDAELTADSSLQSLSIAPLHLRLEQLETAAGLAATLDLQARLKGDLAPGLYRLDDFQMQIDAAGDVLAGGRLNGTLQASAALDLAAETLKVEETSFHSDTLHLSGDASGERLRSDPVVGGRLELAELDLRSWLTAGGFPVPPTADPTALERFAFSLGWQLAGRRLQLQELDLGLDQTRVTGNAELAQPGSPSIRFKLAADRLDFDRYLPPTHAAQETAAVAERPDTPASEPTGTPTHDRAATPVSETPGTLAPPPAGIASSSASGPVAAPVHAVPAEEAVPPVQGARGLDIDGHLHIDEFKVAKLTMGDAHLRLVGQGGELRLENRVERFYLGRSEGRAGVDRRAGEPKVTLAQQATGIQAGPLFADLYGEDKLSGRGDASVHLSATGRTEDDLKRSLAGTLRLSLANGAVKGFDLEHMVRDAAARLQGEELPPPGPLQTLFSTLSASANVQAGVLTNEDLLATSDHLQVTGKGRVDIANERFDYRFEPMFVRPPEGRGIKELEGVPVPIHLAGTFDKPTWKLDTGAALREFGQRKLQEELEGEGSDVFRKLEERTGIKGLGEGLRGLFGR